MQIQEQVKEGEAILELSLLGGPLHRVGFRLGLVRRRTDTVRLGMALGLSIWSVLTLLAILQGLGPKLFSLGAVSVHVRFLVAIPLLFVCETWVAPQMAEFARYIVRSGLVPEESLPALTSEIRRFGGMKDSWLAEALLLAVAFALPALETIGGSPAGTDRWVSVLKSAGGGFTLTNGFYQWFCLPLFRFLLLRWLWRLGLWWHFLWHFSRLKLRLVPTHSDGSAGLGYLEIVHEQFVPLVAAISALLSAQFAEEISSGAMEFDTLERLVPLLLLVIAALFIGPLCMFCAKLWKCYWVGMSEYMGMASRYVNAFDNKWVRNKNVTGEAQLGAQDLQSLADLTNSLNVVRGMRTIPVGKRFLTVLAASVIVPLLPLLLLRYPVDQLAARLFKLAIGF